MLSPDVDAALVEGSVSAVRGDVQAMLARKRRSLSTGIG
jgi:hypothetical protein